MSNEIFLQLALASFRYHLEILLRFLILVIALACR